MSGRADLNAVYDAAVRAVRGGPAVARALRERPPPDGPVTLLAAGKAACGMAEGALEVLGRRVRHGRVHAADGCGRPIAGFEVREAAHPLPDERSVACARDALEVAGSLDAGDVLLVLLSGGASAIWTAPVRGVSFTDKRRVVEDLLRSAVPIDRLNAVRKHLSRIKGGWLAAAAQPARVVTLAVSDVRGDRPDVIGSGPTVPDPTTFAEAWSVLRDAGISADVPRSVCEYLTRGVEGDEPETPGPEGASPARLRVVAGLQDALSAAIREAEARGYRAETFGASVYGEACDEGARLARMTAEARARGIDVLVGGGEPVVRVRGDGRGGRMQEAALAFALAAEGQSYCALFAGTDGRDGPTDAAGAIVDTRSLDRARAAGLDPREHLARNDSTPLIGAAGGLMEARATDTNVADLVVIRTHD